MLHLPPMQEKYQATHSDHCTPNHRAAVVTIPPPYLRWIFAKRLPPPTVKCSLKQMQCQNTSNQVVWVYSNHLKSPCAYYFGVIPSKTYSKLYNSIVLVQYCTFHFMFHISNQDRTTWCYCTCISLVAASFA